MPFTSERYDRDSVRIMRDGKVVGIISRLCDNWWCINDRNDRRIHRRNFPSSTDALAFANRELVDALTPSETPHEG